METNDRGYDPFRAVAGFRAAKGEALDSLRTYYKLNMPVSKLRMIAEIYTKLEKRDPTLSELYLLDGLAAVGTLASNVRITEVRSESAAAGEAFDDIRRNIEVKGGYRLSDIATAADIRLERAGKLPDMLHADGRVRLACGADETGFAPSEVKKTGRKETSGTYCFVSAAGTGFAGERTDMIDRMIADKNVIFSAKTGKGGMLAVMLAAGKSAFVNLSGFDGTSGVQSPDVLTKEFPDSMLLLVDQPDVPAVCRRLSDAGLYVRPVGRKSDAQRLTVVYGGGYPISFPVSLLRAIADAGRVTADICDDSAAADTEKHFSVILDGEETEDFEGYFTCDGNVYTALSVGTPDFFTSAKAVIEAVGRLVAAGADYRKVTLSLASRLGKDIGGDLAMLLGIYRARTELCLAAESNTLTDSEKQSFTVFARAPINGVPIWDKVGDRRRGVISVLPPRTGADGLPDMRDMRLLFDYVQKLIADGNVKSAAFVGSEGAEKALRDMTCGEYEKPLETVPFGSFIVETEKTPDGIPVADRKLQINREI